MGKSMGCSIHHKALTLGDNVAILGRVILISFVLLLSYNTVNSLRMEICIDVLILKYSILHLDLVLASLFRLNHGM